MASTTAAALIECSDQPLDISFHPSRPSLIAAALVDGTVEVHDFSELLKTPTVGARNDDEDDEIDSILSSINVHTQLLPSKTTELGAKQASARCLSFSPDGSLLYSGGTAGDLVGLDADRISTFSPTANQQNSAIRWRLPTASYNKSPLQVMHQLPDHNLLVTGDDAGGVRIWDVRLVSSSSSSSNNIRNNSSANAFNSTSRLPDGCVHSWKEHDDYISGLDHASDGTSLLACSADGTLSVYDLRKNVPTLRTDKERVLRRSDDQEDELLSIKIIKNGRKVVCGTADGVLAVWSWGVWGDVSDRFPGHPSSIDALLKIDEDTLLTGSSDGLIRVVAIHPDKLLGVLGDNHEGFPIEKLAMNCNRTYVGSVTHDATIRLWDCRILQDDYDDDDDDDCGDAVMMKTDSTTQLVANNTGKPGSDEEWEDMDEELEKDSDDSDSDNDDDDDSRQPVGKNEKRSSRFKSENEKFFEDL